MRLHVIYRVHGGENRKSRPDHYDKLTSLRSMLRSIGSSPWEARLTFLVDGLVPPMIEAAMHNAGLIVMCRFGSNRRSLRHGYGLAARSQKDDLVWLAEDDYLYRPEAFTSLHEAVGALPDIAYFAMYGPSTSEHLRDGVSQPIPGLGGPVLESGSTTWHRFGSTTSTFGGRPQDFAADLATLRAVTLSGAAFDHTSNLALAGVAPFHWKRLHRNLVDPLSPRGTRLARATVKLPMRVVADGLSMRRRCQPHLLAGPVPNLATHLQEPFLAPGHDWAAEAADVRRWAGSAH